MNHGKNTNLYIVPPVYKRNEIKTNHTEKVHDFFTLIIFSLFYTDETLFLVINDLNCNKDIEHFQKCA